MQYERNIHSGAVAHPRIDGIEGHIVTIDGDVFVGRTLGRDLILGTAHSDSLADLELNSIYRRMLEQDERKKKV